MSLRQVVEHLRTTAHPTYHIEYGGFLSNHLHHGLLALYQLQAPEDQLQRFVDYYGRKLESPDADLECCFGEPDFFLDLSGHLGKRQSFSYIMKRLRTYVEKYGVEQLLQQFLPTICQGGYGSALHPLIHTGYGYYVYNESKQEYCTTLLEGIAYSIYSYFPCYCSHVSQQTGLHLEVASTLPDSTSCCDSLLTTARHAVKGLMDAIEEGQDTLTQLMQQHANEFQSISTSKLQKNMMLLHRYALPTIHTLVHQHISFTNCNVQFLAPTALIVALTVFTASSRKRDFFLLHGVTAAWALNQLWDEIIKDPLLPSTVLHSYFNALVMTYVAQECPGLDRDEALKHLHPSLEEHPLDSFQLKTKWDQYRSAVLSLPEETTDEHILKVVQVSEWLASRYAQCQSLCDDAVTSVLHGSLNF